jgi:hypothetical protein
MSDFDDILSELRGGDDDDDQSDDNPLASLSADSGDDDLFASLGGDDSDLFGEFADPTELGYGGPDLSALDAAVEAPSSPPPPAVDESAGAADTLAALRGEPDSDQTIPSGQDLTNQLSDQPSWVAQLDDIDIDGEPKKAPAPKPKAASAKARGTASASSAMFLGLTPQQRMILAIFLFLDISVLGCLILVAFDVIGF